MAVAYQKYLAGLEKQQEVLAGISDALMETFAMESVLLRRRKLGDRAGIAAEACPVFLRDAATRLEATARTVLAACSEGDALRTNLAMLRRFAKYEPVDAVAARRRIAGRLLELGRYTV